MYELKFKWLDSLKMPICNYRLIFLAAYSSIQSERRCLQAFDWYICAPLEWLLRNYSISFGYLLSAGFACCTMYKFNYITVFVRLLVLGGTRAKEPDSDIVIAVACALQYFANADCFPFDDAVPDSRILLPFCLLAFYIFRSTNVVALFASFWWFVTLAVLRELPWCMLCKIYLDPMPRPALCSPQPLIAMISSKDAMWPIHAADPFPCLARVMRFIQSQA